MNIGEVTVVKVFANEGGQFGNPVGIIIDEAHDLDSVQRQKIATKLNFSETVFINSLVKAQISIFSPMREVPFAGHAALGAIWFIGNELGHPIDVLSCDVGLIHTWQDNGLTWLKASLEFLPPWQLVQLQSAEEVDTLGQDTINGYEHTLVWSWLDKGKGIVRARTFAPDWGIPEDQANGSGSMLLASTLGRSLEIRHGLGSVIYAAPKVGGLIKLGGRVSA